MVRTQIQLTERQSSRLKEVAEHKGVSVAEVVRRAVDQALDQDSVSDRAERRARALAVVGRFRGTASDVSENHDQYLAEAYRHDHLR
jgi:hypothetical protein